jgi:hypothetical protein
LALAQDAASLARYPVLSGWLHCTARNLAAKSVRAEVRRRAREQEAATMNQLLSAESEVPWKLIAPHLDAALGALSDSERDAVMLRYFENKSAPETAGILGISSEAAQKRVGRGVERLRDYFAKDGIIVGGGGLIVLISTNAVQAAPVGLAATISAVALAGTALTTTATSTAAKAIAATKALTMTTLQKAIVTATVAVLAGAGVYEASKASRLESEFRMLNDQHALLVAQMEQLKSERDETLRQRTAAAADKQGPDVNASELLRLRREVGLLRRQLADLAAIAQTATNQIQFSVPCLPRAAWSDQGTDKPQNTILTMFWAIRQGDQNRLEQLVYRQKDSQTLDDMTVPKSDRDEIAAIRTLGVTVTSGPGLVPTASVEAIVQTVPSQDGTKNVYCPRWVLNKINDQWLITGKGWFH